jgi:hypothetical protein
MARRTRVSVSLVSSGGKNRVKPFQASRGITLNDALEQGGARLEHRHPDWPETYVTGIWFGSQGLRSANARGQFEYGPGTKQLVFYVNGVLFLDHSVLEKEIPTGRRCSVSIRLEEVRSDLAYHVSGEGRVRYLGSRAS